MPASEPSWPLQPWCSASALCAHSPLPDDTSIGLLFVGFLAVAVMIMSTPSAARTGDLERFLFGSINAIDGTDLRRQLAVTFIILLGTLVVYRALLATTFDERLAGTFGFRPGLVRAALLALMALAIVASFETVGNLLVFAFLIAPPATATLLARRVPSIMVTAVGIGAFSAIVGLLISYHHGTGTGATMALCAVATFLVVMVATALARRRAAGEPLPSEA